MDVKALSEFLTELKANNKKVWFDEHRDRYQELRTEFVELVGKIILKIGEFDGAVAYLEPKQCLFRINRDIRFSKNKQPYKPYFSAAFVPRGKKTGNPGYYLQINHTGELWVGGGIYRPSSDQLWNIREDIAKNPEHIHSILDEKSFKKHFNIYDTEKLKTAPQGYSREHPEIELLRLKHFFGMEAVELLGEKKVDLVGYASRVCKNVSPLVKWLREVC